MRSTHLGFMLAVMVFTNGGAMACGDGELQATPLQTSLESRLRQLKTLFIGRVKNVVKTVSADGHSKTIDVEFEVLWPARFAATLDAAHTLQMQATVGDDMVTTCGPGGNGGFDLQGVTTRIDTNEVWLIAGDLLNNDSFQITLESGEAAILSAEKLGIVDSLKEDRLLQ